MSNEQDKRDRLWDAGIAWDDATNEMRLYSGQGRVARNNARKAALAALAKMRRVLDAEFPVIPKKAKPRRKPRTKAQRVRDLRARDYVEAFHRDTLRDCVALKVRVIYVDDSPFVPSWAAATLSKNEMRLAKKSRNMQASLAAHYLFGQRRKAALKGRKNG